MKWKQIGRQWDQAKEKIKETWDRLTDEDLALIDGDRDLLATILRDRYHKEMPTIERELKHFERNCEC